MEGCGEREHRRSIRDVACVALPVDGGSSRAGCVTVEIDADDAVTRVSEPL